MRVLIFVVATALILTGLNQNSSAQIISGQVDDFSLADAMGWQEGSASPNPPTQNFGLGLDGLPGHLQNVSDGSGAGGRWQMWNEDTRWQGNYSAANIVEIALDFENVSGNGTDANLRIGLFGNGGWFVSGANNVSDGSGWQNFSFDLADLNHVAAGGGSGILGDTLTTVSRFEILSSVNPPTFSSNNSVLQGDQLVADFRVDNITAVGAVPEPSATLVVLVSLSGLLMRRQRSCSSC